MIGLKKNCRSLTLNERRSLVEKHNPEITLKRQAELLAISRSSLYYQPRVNPADKKLMDLIDQIYTKYPFFGSRRIRKELKTYHSTIIGRDHVRRLLAELGLEAIYPKTSPNLSIPNQQHKKYPYLLKGFLIKRPNQVWATDITYVKLETGWLYLTAIMDWFSRYVLAWRLSNTLATDFCLRALDQALQKAVPEIFNTDQGAQFTNPDFTGTLASHQIKISMDGRGRCLDNIFTERLWRTIKYENIYLKSYTNPREARLGLIEYFDFYNNHRLHSSLNDQTPAKVYFQF